MTLNDVLPTHGKSNRLLELVGCVKSSMIRRAVIDDKLIPSEGRLLQCGSCNNKWFYKHKLQELSKQESKPIPKIKKNINDTKVQKSEKLIKFFICLYLIF